MFKRDIVQIDRTTGEVIEGVVAVVQSKPRNAFANGWIAMGQEALKALAKSGLEGKDCLVLFLLLSELNFENSIQVNQTELSKELGLYPQQVNRSIRRLLEREIILAGPKVGIHKTYRLNPLFGWKGKSSAHKSAIKHLKVVSQTTPENHRQEESDCPPPALRADPSLAGGIRKPAGGKGSVNLSPRWKTFPARCEAQETGLALVSEAKPTADS